jgi:predicted nucleic acid-binding protein
VYLVDTSVFTRLHHASVRKELDAFAPEELARSSVTDLELGFSARNGTEWDTGAEMLDAFPRLPLSEDLVSRASEIQRILADRGLRGRKLPDLLIAATAEAAGAVLVHYDHDFELIAGVTGQPAQWIVRRGSVD